METIFSGEGDIPLCPVKVWMEDQLFRVRERERERADDGATATSSVAVT